ncbi:biosynthetic-type acetolactate synthase large subunit [Basilea psittacipulmonis]|uniref:Acetolactate synthase n=1 Tax=Basilea psittacipulmonis DSM 24701 TaxID=1072685 RepID=A0A077DG62_9BURK|nr:biosynthetic-type acetolactate synthase large subunit [Basilea psittacipulmonis]AIL33166.1 acetolactate synthase 3 catalytic subunit [Basilea psittacipulmonis DSM 24701]
MELNGAEILVRCLEEQNVDCVFGYPGGAVLYIYDAIFKQNQFKHILVRHEQAAVHAADAYSRVNPGKVGVALVTSGPGLTNAVTGIATAYMDSIPLVVISGQVGSHMIGEDAFQECDAIGVTRPCVKHNFLVRDVKDLANVMRKAFHIARTGRPGPVLVDIPKDVSANRCKYTPMTEPISLRSYNPIEKGHTGQIKKAAQLLAQASRPMIYVGGGAILSNASAECRELIRLLNAPCVSTLMGLGAVNADLPNFLGLVGMHGLYEANLAMQNSDVLIAIGARFDDRVVANVADFSSVPRKVIHIDIDPSSISKRVVADIPIVGNAKDVLQELNAILQEGSFLSKQNTKALSKWWDQINEWRGKKCLDYQPSDTVIKPQFVIETLHKVTNGDAYICSDVGQHQMWAAQYYGFKDPRKWLNSGGLGTMGVGLPYGIGVCASKNDAPVAVITGDGSIQMNIQELATCTQYGLAPKIICLNNRFLGMVRQWQELEYERRYSESYMESIPDFVQLMKAYGHVGILVTKPSEVEPALREAFYGEHKDKLVFLDIRTDREQNVWPMVQAGKGLSQILLGPDVENKG